jgi:hypothetical protein
MGPSATEEVIRTGWWTVSTSPDAAAAWLSAHVPHGATLGATGNGSAYRIVEYDEPSTPVLVTRAIECAIAALPGDRSVIRVDAVEIYRPAKPAAEVVPVTRLLNVGVVPGAGTTIHASSRTVTDRSTIAKVAAIINALPTVPDEAFSCPADSGAAIDLVFWNGGESPMLARVRLPLSGCQNLISVTVGKGRQPTLDATTSSTQAPATTRIASLLDLTIPSATAAH